MWDELVMRAFLWLFVNLPNRSRVVPAADDPATQMLMQFALIKGRLYLQHFMTAESYDYFHTHRWTYMRSFVLSSGYVEERPGGFNITRTRFHTHSMDHSTIHRVAYWDDNCVTLFYMSKEQTDAYGYHRAYPLRHTDFIGWRDHVQHRIPSLETGEITP